MKAKIFLLILMVQMSFSYAANGELIFKFLNGTTPGTFNLTVSSTNYSWHWENNTVTFDNNLYYHAVTNKIEYDFSAPKLSPGDGDYPISWGLMVFNIVTNTGLSRTFTLDLRDENWSHVSPYQDTFIMIDNTASKIYISKSSSALVDEIALLGHTIKIWQYWGSSPVVDDDFNVPVALSNRVEGETFDFGYLKANGTTNVTSGQNGFFLPDETEFVQHGTIETNYDNERRYSFKWTHTFADPVGTQNVYSSQYNFTVTNQVQDKSITRNFRTVYPLTIKNLMPELNPSTSAGSIWFKDPTTDNQSHPYSASGSGFVKNETFKGFE